LVPGKLSLGVVTRTLQGLLQEGVPIRDMRTVVEALTEASARSQDPEQLTALIRPKLGRLIVQSLTETRDTLSVLTLEPTLEQMIHNVVQQNGGSANVVLEPSLADGLFTALRQNARDMEEKGIPAVLVVSPAIRNWMARAVRFRVSDLTVLSYSEIPDDQSVQVLASVAAQPRDSDTTE